MSMPAVRAERLRFLGGAKREVRQRGHWGSTKLANAQDTGDKMERGGRWIEEERRRSG